MRNGRIMAFWRTRAAIGGAAGLMTLTFRIQMAAAPVAPTGCIAIPGNGMVSLAWKQVTGAQTYSIYRSTSAADSGTKLVSGYKVYVDTTLFPPEPANFLCDYPDTNLTNGTTYYYRVTAVGGGESPRSAQVSAKPVGGSTAITKSRFLKIMCMGNSITSGWQGPDVPGGYRTTLYDSLTHNNYNFLLVGSYVKQSVGMADPYHEGYNNKTVMQLNHGQAGRAIRAYKPDIVLLEIGTNDFAWKWGSDGDVPGTLAAYDSLLTTIYKYGPGVTVFAAPIPPVGPNVTSDDSIKVRRIAQFDAGIKNLMTARGASGRSAIFVDSMYAMTLAYIGDNVHPTTAGYALMGATWYRAIDAVARSTGAIMGRQASPRSFLVRNGSFLHAGGQGNAGIRLYSVNGSRLTPRNCRGLATVRPPARPGVYIADIARADGSVERRLVVE